MSLDCNKIHFLIQDRRETSDENKFDKVQHADLCQVKTMLQIIGLGKTGADGPQGFQGPSGADGNIGPQGIQGAASETPGPTGEPGPQGTMGDVGPTGAMGNQGPQGNAGPGGGPTGDLGPQGFQGMKGESGGDGAMGAQGFQGNEPGGLALSDLTDVDATGATGGEYLCFDGNEWTNAAIALDDLSDVNALNATGSSLFFNGTIWNASNRDLYDAIADPSGNGDFTSIAAAFSAGNLTVFARDGNYTETSNVTIPDGGHLIGESIDGVQITLSGAVSVRADGNGGTVETAGTISITTGIRIVTGSGTTFTNLNPVGDNTYISIKGICYLVDLVNSNTNIRLVEFYRGEDVSGESFRALQLHKGIIMQNLTIKEGSSNGVFFRAVRDGLISNIRVDSCVDGFSIDDCCHSTIQDCITENNSSDGFIVNNSTSISFENCLSFNNVTDGFRATNANLNLIFDACQGSSNGNDGIKIDGTADEVNITDSIFNNNVLVGIQTEPGTLSCTITSCTTLCNQFGIDVDGVNNTVDSCIVGNNFEEGFLTGNNTSVVGCQIYSNGKAPVSLIGAGLVIDRDSRVQAIGNFIFDNGDGGAFAAGITFNSFLGIISEKHTITGNVIVSNTRGIISTRTAGTDPIPNLIIISNNYIANNVFQGIYLSLTVDGPHFNVTGNIIRNNGTNGIETLANDDCIFSNNTIIGNTGHGMTINGDTCLINGNRVTLNTIDGIRIESGSTDVTYYSNNTQGNLGTNFVDNGTITTAYEAVLANELDARSATTLQLGPSIATKVDIGDAGIDIEVRGTLFIDRVDELATTTKVLTWDDSNNEVHYKEQEDLPGATGAGGYGYGAIYLDRITNDGPTGLTITAKMGRVAEGDPFLTATTSNTQLFTLWNTNGLSSGTTPDHTTDSITITKTGVYSISLRASLEATSTDGVWFFVFKDDGGTNAPLGGNLSNIYETLGTNSQNVTVSGIASLTAGDEITLRMSSLSVTFDAVIEVYSASFAVVKIS